MSEENVLVIPTSRIKAICDFQGFSSCEKLKAIIDSPELTYLPRSQAENNPEYKQLIPYIIFASDVEGDKKDEYKVLLYFRGKAGGEKRLEAKASLGFGGHVNSQDASYLAGAAREIDEELQNVTFSEKELADSIIGFVNDDSNAVGQVHIGIVHLLNITPAIPVYPKDPAVELPVWVTYYKLPYYNLESWSSICVPHIAGYVNK